MSSELVETSRLFARRNAAVKPDWIEEAAAHLVSRSYSEPHWSAKRGATVAVERVTLFGIPLVTGRNVDYGRIDPPLCRELFIRGALVEGEWSTRHRFWHANVAALKAAEEVEERSRRRGLVIDDEGLFAFYDARIPADITSVRHFDSWWKKASRQTPDLLTLTPADIHVAGEDLPDEGDFPLRWSAGPEVTLSLSYAFEPGDAADGVTVDVPLAVLPDLDPAEVPGAAPGLRGDLVTALLRSPAKAIRRELGPAPNLVPSVLAAPELAEQPILEAVAAAVTRTHRGPGAGRGLGPRPRADAPAAALPRGRRVRGRPRRGSRPGRASAPARPRPRGDARPRCRRHHRLRRHHVDASAPSRPPWSGSSPVCRSPGTRRWSTAADPSTSRCWPTRARRQRSHLRGVRRLVALSVPNPAPRGHSGLDMTGRLILGRYPHGGAQALLDDCTDACIDTLLAGTADPRCPVLRRQPSRGSPWSCRGAYAARARAGGHGPGPGLGGRAVCRRPEVTAWSPTQPTTCARSWSASSGHGP